MAYDSKDVIGIYGELKSHYSASHAGMEREDRLFEQEFGGILDVPYEVRIFKSSTAANIIEGFRNQIRTNEPTVLFHAGGPSRQAEKHATLMQKWGYDQLRKERTRAVIDPNLQCGFDLLLRGAACKKIIVNVDDMMEKPPPRSGPKRDAWMERAQRAWPFISRAIDPLSIFPAPGSLKPYPFIIERQMRLAAELWELYPNWVDPMGKKNPARQVEWLEFWSADTMSGKMLVPGQYIAIADGRQVFSRDNPYGIHPYIFEYSGMGRQHNDGDPEHLSVGILTGIMGELEEEVILKTAISVQTQMHVFPPILTVEDPKKVAQQFGVGPGKVIRHPPGHPPVYMSYPAPNENMYRFLDTIHQNIARQISPALGGQRDAGVRFGVLQAQMIGQALTTIAPIRNTLDMIGTQTLNMMATMSKRLDLHTAVQGNREPVEAPYRLRGTDFQHLNFEVTFEAVDPAENDRALLVGEALRRARDISQRTFWKKYAKHVVEDPDQERVNLLEESILDQLAASGALGQAALSQDVQEQMQEQAQESQNLASAQVQQNQQTRQNETTPQGASANARELESISGTPGSSTIPREIVEAGMANASPSQSGVPSR